MTDQVTTPVPDHTPVPPGQLPVRDMVRSARRTMIGRRRDIEVVAASLAAGRSVLLEGPPGTGKTTLLRSLAAGAGVSLHLVEGNAELSPARLVGHHDPSRILNEGYRPENFVPGPLVEAMTLGGLLYVEELNRVPEETLNVLLGVLSERRMQVPRLGEIVADPRFRLVAAMNPFDAVGTGRVSPALYDRSCRVAVDYQDEDEERLVVKAATGGDDVLVVRAVTAVRMTRDHPDLRTGSSVRGAIDVVAVAGALAELRNFPTAPAAAAEVGLDAALTALSGRVSLREGTTRTAEEILTEIWAAAAPQPEPTGEDGDDGGKAPGPGAMAART